MKFEKKPFTFLTLFIQIFINGIQATYVMHTYVPFPPSTEKLRNVGTDLMSKFPCDLKCIERTVTSYSTAFEQPDFSHSKTSGHDQNPVQQPLATECSMIENDAKFDCFPGNGISMEECEERGCCWNEKQSTNSSGREPPQCFFPPEYSGYQFTSKTDEQMGPSGTLQRNTSSGYPDDAMELQIDFRYETNTRLRIRVYDPNHLRWEVPLPVMEEVETPANNPEYTVEIFKTKGSFQILRKSNNQTLFDTSAAPLVYSDQFIQISTTLASQYIYGLGQHMDGFLLDTNWYTRVLWNYDQQIRNESNLYGSHPFYLSFETDHAAHGVFFHNSNTMEFVIQPLPAVTFRTLGGVLDFYMFLGPTPQDVIRQYTDLIGKPFLPPYWSLGYHQSRWQYNSIEKTREIWKQTRDAGIPFDVQWNDIDCLYNARIFTYNNETFSTLPEFIDELHSVGMRYIPIVDAGVGANTAPGEYPAYDDGKNQSVFVKNENGETYIGQVWPGDTAWPDFTNADTMVYWAKQLSDYYDTIKYDGIWLDMNEPADFVEGTAKCEENQYTLPPYTSNVSGIVLSDRTICMSANHQISLHYNLHNMHSITHCQATNIALRSVRGSRPFIITRSTYPGVGFYAGHWQGDSVSSYYMLQTSIQEILNFQLFGIPMVGADICGFHEDTTINLCKMWYLVGAMYPFSRNHNDDKSIPQDPVSLGEDVVAVAKTALTVRYRLLPFYYSLFFNSHLTGDPVVHPLFYEFPEDENTYSVDEQFMLGGALLIIPALHENMYTIETYIPAELWYNWYTGDLMFNSSSQYFSVDIPEDRPNIFIRGGYIVPVQAPNVTTELSRKNGFGIEVALDFNRTARGYLYFDDGESLNTITTGQYNYIEFYAHANSIKFLAEVGYHEDMIIDYIRVLGLQITHIDSVSIDGHETTFTYDNQILEMNDFNQTMLNNFEVTWTSS